MKNITLADVLTNIDSGGRPKGGIKEGEGEIPSLGAEHLNDEGGFNFKKLKCVTRAFYNTLQKGHIELRDILIVKDGATTGKVSFVSDKFPYKEASINEHLFRLSINSQIAFPNYIFYYLRSSFGQKQILSDFRGATVGGISRDFINKVHFPLPSLSEQKRIAAILDKADAVRRKRQETIGLVDEFLRSVFLEMFGDPVRNEKGWEVKKLGQIAKIIMGQSPEGESYNYIGKGVPLLNGPTEFGKKHPIEKQWTVNPKKFSEPGDILFCVRGATAGRMNISDKKYCIGRGLAAIHTKTEISNEYIYLILKNHYKHFQQTGNGSTFINIDKEKLEKVPIPITPSVLQSKFYKITMITEQQKELLEKSLSEMENNFDSIIQKAFHGEL